MKLIDDDDASSRSTPLSDARLAFRTTRLTQVCSERACADVTDRLEQPKLCRRRYSQRSGFPKCSFRGNIWKSQIFNCSAELLIVQK